MADSQADGTGTPPGTVRAPRTRLESAIANIWQELLGVDSVGVEDDFFELGGESLEAVSMLAAVDDLLLVQVSFADFLDEPTVAGVAAAVARERETPPTGVVDAPSAGPDVSADGGEAPCSFAQERLWFVTQLSGPSAAYNEQRGVRLRGPLDAGVLERSLATVIGRHAALRTAFAERDGVPVQVVSDAAPVAFEHVDAAGSPDPEAALARATAEFVAAPFDLATAPLVRALLVRLAVDEHMLALSFHHNVCDGWSHVVVLRELGIIYDAMIGGVADGLPAPRIQYPEYARAQRARLDREALDTRLEPWVARLDGAPQRLELSTDRPRPAVPSYRGATYRHTVPEPVVAGLRELARSTGATQFQAALAVYYALLHRHSGQDDILIGATTSGRDRPELEDGVGLFASTVVLRGDLAGSPSVRELVGRVRETVLWAVAHQDAPFDQLVARLAPERDLSRHPLFQVFVAQVPAAPIALPGLAAEPYDARPPTSRFDITLFFEEGAGGTLALAWEYSTDLFDAATLERLSRQYLRLLCAAVADPEQPIDQLPLLDEAECDELLAAAGSGEERSFPVACMHARFEQAAAATPDAIAVRHEGASLTYGELNARANRLAHRLRALGAAPDGLVALFLEPSPEMIVAILGVLKAGAAYVPLDPEYPSERLSFVLEDTRAPLIVTTRSLASRLPGHAATVVDVDDPALAQSPAHDPEPLATPEHLAYVIYTSGSTGRPKGVMVEHRNVARLFTATDAWYGFGPADTWVLLHSYAFDFSVWELWGALAYGGTLVISPLWTTRSPSDLAALLAETGVTVLNATPSLFVTVAPELLARAPQLALRWVVFGGEALQTAALRPWYDHHGDDGPTLVNMYGITETTVHVTYRPLRASDCERDASPIGEPIPDLSLFVLDAHRRPVPYGVAGELYVGGAGVARGYLNRAELTAERFIDNPFGAGRLYRTGDVARRTADGELDFRGRIDDQVKVRGFRIELGEIQAAIREVMGVADAAVIAVEATPGDLRLAAYVVGADADAGPGEAALRAAVTAHLQSRLPEFMVPASMTVLERFPLTRNGKIDRAALPAPAWETASAAGAAVALTPAQARIAEIWTDVLGIERVAPEDSFFHLGGHSLLAARVITRVRAAFAIELSVRAMFEEPTLAGFAARVEAIAGPVEEAAPEVAEVAEIAAGGAAGDAGGRTTFPLAFPQQQLLFFDELSPSTYNAALAISVSGDLDLEAVRRALRELFVRHAALRTVYVWGDEAPSQVVLSSWEVPLSVADLSGVPAEERVIALERQMREHALAPFDLAKDVLLRTTVFELGDDERVILFQTHHITFDAWAVEVLYRDLGELYNASRAGRTPQLPELALGYGDFAIEQRERMQGDTLARKLDFWRSQLAGAPTTVALPTDQRHPAMQTFDGASLEFSLGREVADGVRALARETGATPYMVALAAFGSLLYRLGGQDDILIGGPMANRDGPRYENVIGFFANTVVVRVRLGGNPTFAELVERARESVLGSYEHQDVPFELVVEALRPDRDPGRNPIFQVNFRVRVGGLPSLELVGARTRQRPLDLGFARFELALELHVHDDRIDGELIYNTALWGPESAQRMAAEFEGLLRQAVAAPQTRLLGLELSANGHLGEGEGAAAAGARAGIRGFRSGASSAG